MPSPSSGSPHLPGFVPPRQIETQRLELRTWKPEDAPMLKGVIDRNLNHLMPWIPWAPDYPKTVEEMFADVARSYVSSMKVPRGRTVFFGVTIIH